MAFTPIQKLIPRAAGRLGIKRQIEAAHVCALYQKIAPVVVRPDALEYTSARSFKNSTLYVNVPNSAWAHEIMLHEKTLLQSLADALRKNSVTRIKTFVS